MEEKKITQIWCVEFEPEQAAIHFKKLNAKKKRNNCVIQNLMRNLNAYMCRSKLNESVNDTLFYEIPKMCSTLSAYRPCDTHQTDVIKSIINNRKLLLCLLKLLFHFHHYLSTQSVLFYARIIIILYQKYSLMHYLNFSWNGNITFGYWFYFVYFVVEKLETLYGQIYIYCIQATIWCKVLSDSYQEWCALSMLKFKEFKTRSSEFVYSIFVSALILNIIFVMTFTICR